MSFNEEEDILFTLNVNSTISAYSFTEKKVLFELHIDDHIVGIKGAKGNCVYAAFKNSLFKIENGKIVLERKLDSETNIEAFTFSDLYSELYIGYNKDMQNVFINQL